MWVLLQLLHVEHFSVTEVLGQPLCVRTFSKSMNKEGSESLTKFCIVAGCIFSEKSDSLGGLHGTVVPSNKITF